MNTESKKNFFYCYATANDSRLYLKDVQNFLRIKKKQTGYSKVILFVAISTVKKVNIFDSIFRFCITKLFKNHPTIELREIFFKSNIGRDFSSYEQLLLKVAPIANQNDYIFFQNRSGYGPLKNNWYTSFVEQLDRFPSSAICGSTINFKDHNLRSNNTLPHIQTFAFLTKVKFTNLLHGIFPGSTETDKLGVICNGEIAYSQFFLKKGYTITCIEWPQHEISNSTEPFEGNDIKENPSAEHSFYHRKYYKHNFFKKVAKGCFAWLVVYYYVLFQK